MQLQMFFSLPEVAARCHVSRQTVWRWVRSNRLRSTVYAGRHVVNLRDLQVMELYLEAAARLHRMPGSRRHRSSRK